MILATVTFPRDEQDHAVDLLEDGRWKHRGAASPALEAVLNTVASLDRYGPSAGDPVRRAAAEVAEVLGGVIHAIQEPEPDPPGTVY